MKSPAPRIKVVVTTDVRHGGIEKLAPNRELVMGDCGLLFNPPAGTDCDFWIVFAAGRASDKMRVAPNNTLFIAGEPPTKKVYPAKFYRQFAHVVSCHADDPHPDVHVSAPCLPWHIGLDRSSDSYLFGYEHLSGLSVPEQKIDKISVVCSDLRTTQGQRDRLQFLQWIKQALPDKIVHFGRGFNPIDDKMDAILPYRYHLVLENSLVDHYWTEKLADAYLGWSHPIYSGCRNLDDYFPTDSFTPIDIHKPEEALARIQLLLANKDALSSIQESRRRILNDYNPFVRFADWARKFYLPGDPKKAMTIRNHRAFRPFPRGYLFQIKSYLRNG